MTPATLIACTLYICIILSFYNYNDMCIVHVHEFQYLNVHVPHPIMTTVDPYMNELDCSQPLKTIHTLYL